MSDAYKGGEGNQAWRDVIDWHKKQPTFGAAAARRRRKKSRPKTKKPSRFSPGVSKDTSNSYKKPKR